MTTFPINPTLIPLGENTSDWLALCIPAALSVEDWEIGETDAKILLPKAMKNACYLARFQWSNAEGTEVAKADATHLSVQIGSVDATAKGCESEQQALVSRIIVCREGTIVDLA